MNDSETKYFLLFASCIPVRGYESSLIYDLERQEVIKIDNLVYEVLKNNEGKTTKELKIFYNNKYDKGIDTFFSKFVELEYGFFTNSIENFPSMGLGWDSPFIIENAVLEFKKSTDYDIQEVVRELDSLGCQGIQIRFLDETDLYEIDKILSLFSKSRIKGLDLFIKYISNFDSLIKYAENLLNKHKRIVRLTIHSSPNTAMTDLLEISQKRIFVTNKIIDDKAKEVIKLENFVLSIPIFSEAHNYNIGLNRKVSIDFKGNIKNYPTHQSVFGNVKNQKIYNIVKELDFRTKWDITNDMIEQCKDCQFRYMCLSNSDILKIKDKFYKKDYCNFDPYKNSWAIDSD